MELQAITLSLPVDIYQRFQQMAKAIQRPLEDIVFHTCPAKSETIRGNLPPVVDDLPPKWQAELVSLQNLNSQDLWAITKETLPPQQWEDHQDLLYKNQTSTLSPPEKKELEYFQIETDRFVFRRSYALALLKWRGLLPKV